MSFCCMDIVETIRASGTYWLVVTFIVTGIVCRKPLEERYLLEISKVLHK